MSKKRFIVMWSKAYYANGTMEIEAQSAKEAESKMDEIIGNQEGNMQYYPDDNLIKVTEKEY